MLRGILFLVVVHLVGSLVAADPAAVWRKAEEAYAKGRPYKAVNLCGRMVAGGGEQRFLVLRSVGQNRLGYHEKALHDATTGLPYVKGDTLDLAHVQIGIALAALGHGDSARHWFAQAFEGAHGAEARRRTAEWLKRKGQWADAKALLDEVLRRTPDDAAALRERGGCLAALGDTAAARIDLDRAVALSPRDPVAWNSRGYELYARTGRWEEALADFERAIKLDPNYSFAFNNKGFALHKLGRTDKGLKAIALAGRKRPENPHVPRNLGLIALDRGDTAKACGHFRQALTLGFTAQYGPEVEELVRGHCPDAPPPAMPTPAAAPDTPRQNAPTKLPPRSNAP
jgi:tetratricopeptide (TPR) repeat protein